jgi:KEOPS complex subunit Cgi121
MMDKKFKIIGVTGKIHSVEDFIKKAREFICDSDSLLQFIDAEKVLGKEHIQSAIEHAIRAFDRQDNISANLAMEILIYTAGKPQIQTALDEIGIKAGCDKMVIIADDKIEINGLLDHLNLKRDDDVLIFKESKLREFGVSESEITACDKNRIKDLILERIAMVDVRK